MEKKAPKKQRKKRAPNGAKAAREKAKMEREKAEFDILLQAGVDLIETRKRLESIDARGDGAVVPPYEYGRAERVHRAEANKLVSTARCFLVLGLGDAAACKDHPVGMLKALRGPVDVVVQAGKWELLHMLDTFMQGQEELVEAIDQRYKKELAVAKKIELGAEKELAALEEEAGGDFGASGKDALESLEGEEGEADAP